MAIHELNEEEIRTWSLEEKDTWWLKTVYRGAMPQLTIRSAITGMCLGSLLSLTNLYVGAKTGWTLGVGITSVILAFALFKVLAKLHLSSEFTILENNAMQSIATAAGYMTSPLISSLAAYMMVTNRVIPLWQAMAWMTLLAALGVLFAFPFKRRFINDEQQPFPEGRAAGVVMDSLHHGDAEAGLLKAKLLVICGSVAALIKLLQSESILALARFKSLPNFKIPAIPEYYDTWLYQWMDKTPHILGTPVTNLTLRPELDVPMIGAGGLMGIRTGFSLFLGALINYAILAPIVIRMGDITPNARGTIGFREITFWSLWCGVAMMTMASLLTFFAKPDVLFSSFRNLFGGRKSPVRPPAAESGTSELPRWAPPERPEGEDISTQPQTTEPDERVSSQPQPVADGASGPSVKPGADRDFYDTAEAMRRIELPLGVSLVGIPILGVVVAIMAHSFFGVPYWLSAIALVLVFGFCLIAINSTGLTSITPIGAMGKLTQLTFGVLAPGNREVNLMTAGITGEVASHAANLLQDIKPGYMLGAKPRQQAVGHLLGIFAGALLSVPIFYIVFLGLKGQTFDPNLNVPFEGRIAANEYPMPAATIWKAVADVLTQGIHMIPFSAQIAALVGIVLGLLFEAIRLRSKNRFPLSPVALGLGFLIPFSTCLAMFLGSFVFWMCEKASPDKESKMNRVVVQNQEPICAGLIAGGALMGIAAAVASLFVKG